MATPTTLPASFTAGAVLTAAQMNDLRGAFRVLQVVSATYSTETISSSATFADTGLTASITPSATSSKILVLIQQNGVLKGSGATNAACNMRLMRGATELQKTSQIGRTDTNMLNLVGNVCFVQIDSPSTTSSTTYKTQFASDNGVANGAWVQQGGSQSTIVLFEVSA